MGDVSPPAVTFGEKGKPTFRDAWCRYSNSVQQGHSHFHTDEVMSFNLIPYLSGVLDVACGDHEISFFEK